MRQLHLAIIGFGEVGRELTRMILDQGSGLAERAGVEMAITALADSTGAIYIENQQMLAAVLEQKVSGKGLGHLAGGHRAWGMEEFLSHAKVLVELGPTDLQTGQPSLDRIRWALALGKHVIAGNKGPLALDYPGLMRMAETGNLILKYGAAICGGLPVLSTVRGFEGSIITGFEGILGATPNHILSRMEADGLDYHAALNLTQALGIAERDPRLDVEGWDTAAKTVILANALLGANLSLAQVTVKGITDISALDLALARRQGGALKLVGWAKKQGDRVYAQVEPKVLPLNHPLAGVSGASQGIMIESEPLGSVTLSSGASNPTIAAAAVLRDLIHLSREIPAPAVGIPYQQTDE